MTEKIEMLKTGEYESGFVLNSSCNSNVRIHFIEKKSNSDLLPVIYFPGLWEPAERAFPLFDGLDSHCISLSFRGRGLSDTPECGYDLEHHISDARAVIDELKPGPFVIVAFSRGVGYACG